MVAQLVKNPPAMWETWVPSLGWEDALEKGKATHFSTWNSPGQNTEVVSLSLQVIFPTQGWNPGLPHCRQILYQLSHK